MALAFFVFLCFEFEKLIVTSILKNEAASKRGRVKYYSVKPTKSMNESSTNRADAQKNIGLYLTPMKIFRN